MKLPVWLPGARGPAGAPDCKGPGRKLNRKLNIFKEKIKKINILLINIEFPVEFPARSFAIWGNSPAELIPGWQKVPAVFASKHLGPTFWFLPLAQLLRLLGIPSSVSCGFSGKEHVDDERLRASRWVRYVKSIPWLGGKNRKHKHKHKAALHSQSANYKSIGNFILQIVAPQSHTHLTLRMQAVGEFMFAFLFIPPMYGLH